MTKAIILAGGFGTRLKSISGDTPKCLMPVMGRPMVDIIIRNMKMQGIDDITLALHYRAQDFVKAFGNTVKYKIESKPLGTGGAIRNCIELESEEPVLVVNGDTITHIDYNDMLAIHIEPLTIAITQKNGYTTSAGIYIINSWLFDDAPDGAFSFETFIMNEPKKFYNIEWFSDLGTPETYQNAPREWI